VNVKNFNDITEVAIMLTFSVNSDIKSVMKQLVRINLNPTTQKGREWLSEVVIKALQGKIDDDVDVDAYGYACDRNTQLAKNSREVALLSQEELDDNYIGVASTVASYVDNNIDSIIESVDTKSFVDAFLKTREDISILEGKDIWRLLKRAKLGDTKAIHTIGNLNTKYNLQEMITDLLTCHNYMEAVGGILC
jgi:hypothetical protein